MRSRVGMIRLCGLAEGRKRYGGFLWHHWREPHPYQPSACLPHKATVWRLKAKIEKSPFRAFFDPPHLPKKIYLLYIIYKLQFLFYEIFCMTHPNRGCLTNLLREPLEGVDVEKNDSIRNCSPYMILASKIFFRALPVHLDPEIRFSGSTLD